MDKIAPKPLDLIWARYGPKHYLLLCVGSAQSGNTTALLADNIPNGEIAIIKKHIIELHKMGTEELRTWFRLATPISWSRAHRTFKTNLIEVVRNFDISKL